MPDLRDLTYEQLVALGEDPALKAFRRNMEGAEASLGIYIELRRHRGVIDSKDLEADHQDIIGVTKGAVVSSFSALDALVHAILKAELPSEHFEKIRFKTYQSSKQISSALKLLGIANDFSTICQRMSSDLYRPEDVANHLDAYYDRKNYITHHADLDEDGNEIKFYPAYALSCVTFIRDFGCALHLTAFRV